MSQITSVAFLNFREAAFQYCILISYLGRIRLTTLKRCLLSACYVPSARLKTETGDVAGSVEVEASPGWVRTSLARCDLQAVISFHAHCVADRCRPGHM